MLPVLFFGIFPFGKQKNCRKVVQGANLYVIQGAKQYDQAYGYFYYEPIRATVETGVVCFSFSVSDILPIFCFRYFAPPGPVPTSHLPAA